MFGSNAFNSLIFVPICLILFTYSNTISSGFLKVSDVLKNAESLFVVFGVK